MSRTPRSGASFRFPIDGARRLDRRTGVKTGVEDLQGPDRLLRADDLPGMDARERLRDPSRGRASRRRGDADERKAAAAHLRERAESGLACAVLWDPAEMFWTPEMSIATTIIPWTSEWLLFFEYWQISGEFLGPGRHPPRRRNECQKPLETSDPATRARRGRFLSAEFHRIGRKAGVFATYLSTGAALRDCSLHYSRRTRTTLPRRRIRRRLFRSGRRHLHRRHHRARSRSRPEGIGTRRGLRTTGSGDLSRTDELARRRMRRS
jgi:hypothetical protein